MPRNLVVCFDGTNNQFGPGNTNVVRLVQALDRDPARQRLYYDPGVLSLGLLAGGCWLHRSGAYHDIADLYGDYARGYDPPPNQVVGMTSCYGAAWDGFSMRIWRDIKAHRGDALYRRMRAHQYRQLSRTYRHAESRPWRSLPLDPPKDP